MAVKTFLRKIAIISTLVALLVTLINVTPVQSLLFVILKLLKYFPYSFI